MKYADAGVNIAVAEDAKQRIRRLAGRTFTPGVLGGIGSFGALFALDRKRWKDPVLVSSADGVGTKLKIAMAMGVHSTVGADLVNHCINDILSQGAEPLFFLDYLAMGKLDAAVVEQLVEGMSRACKRAGCALMAGLHTNGYSLARKLVFETAKLKPGTYVAEVQNKIGAELLKPHLCYAPALKNIVARGWLSALAHITGGGIPGNLPRVLPTTTQAVVELGSWPVPAIFRYLASIGKMERDELLKTFNLGVGMILVVPLKYLSRVEAELKHRREKFFHLGRIDRAAPHKNRVVCSGSLNL